MVLDMKNSKNIWIKIDAMQINFSDRIGYGVFQEYMCVYIREIWFIMTPWLWYRRHVIVKKNENSQFFVVILLKEYCRDYLL